MNIKLILVLSLLFISCSTTKFIGGKPTYRYVKPKISQMNKMEILTVKDKDWSTQYLADETKANRFTDDTIQRILKIQNEARKWDMLKRKYFFTFKNKYAGRIGIYQTATEGETLRLISFKLYMDHVRAYDIQKLNPSIKKIDEPLNRRSLIYYEIPVISNVFQPTGIPIRAQDGEGIIALSYRVTKDVSSWVDMYKNNTIFLKNPNKLKSGDVLYYDAEWNSAIDPGRRTVIPEVIYSSSDVEYHFLMKANMIQSEGSLAGVATKEFNEFR